MTRKKRTRAHPLHPENVRLALAFIRRARPDMQVFKPGSTEEGLGVCWYVRPRHLRGSGAITWGATGTGATRSEAIVDMAIELGFDLRAERKKAAHVHSDPARTN